MSGIAELLDSSGFVSRRGEPVEHAADGARIVYLHAGHLYASAEAARITTILGSCVAVCVWDPVTRSGGMNHFMLPQDVGANCATARYANFAINTLFERLAGYGAVFANLQAKLFGGACVVSSLQSIGRDLGTKNVEAARERLSHLGIPIVAENVGGHYGRKLLFRTDTGVVMLKRIQ